MNTLENITKNSVEIFEYCSKRNVKLLIATKTHSTIEIFNNSLINPNIYIGENRIQESEIKQKILQSFSNKKHFIGSLQKNKVRKAIQLFDCIETVDSLSLLERINRIAKEENKKMEIYININISHDDAKSGMTPEQALQFFTECKESKYEYIRITGLFTILKFGCSDEEKRMHYREMKKIFDTIQLFFAKEYFINLSMGMSGDYKIAIEEGATVVRIGTGIFGKRKKL